MLWLPVVLDAYVYKLFMIDYTKTFRTIDWQGLLKYFARVCNVYTMLSNCLLLLYYEADPR